MSSESKKNAHLQHHLGTFFMPTLSYSITSDFWGYLRPPLPTLIQDVIDGRSLTKTQFLARWEFPVSMLLSHVVHKTFYARITNALFSRISGQQRICQPIGCKEIDSYNYCIIFCQMFSIKSQASPVLTRQFKLLLSKKQYTVSFKDLGQSPKQPSNYKNFVI